MSKMLTIIILISLFTSLHCQSYSMLVSSSCLKPVTIPYTVATYGPNPTFKKSYLIGLNNYQQLCTSSVFKDSLKYSDALIGTKAILAKRGTCPFVNKTKIAQQLGMDVLIIYDNYIDNSNIVPTSKGTPTGINIPTLFINNSDGMIIKKAMQNCLSTFYIQILQTHQQKQTQKQPQKKNIQLPLLYFNIADRTSFSFLQQFYYHPYFEVFEPLIAYKHAIVYSTNLCLSSQCKEQENCIFTKTGMSPYQLCVQNSYRHTGRQILLEQLRSYLVMNQLGAKIWWKYAIVFSENLCHQKAQVQACFQKSLNQLVTDPNISKDIIKKLNILSQSTYADFQKSTHNAQLVQTIIKINKLEYKSAVYPALHKLCQQLPNPPADACKRLNHKPILHKLTKFEQIKQQFFEPTQKLNKTVVQIVKIQLGQYVLQYLGELIFVISRCQKQSTMSSIAANHSNIVYTLMKINQWAVLANGMRLIQLMIKWLSQHIIHLKKKDILQGFITLKLKLSRSYKSYFRIIPKNKAKVVIERNSYIGLLKEELLVYQLRLQNTEDSTLKYFAITVEVNRRNVQIQFYWNKQLSNLFYISTYSGSLYKAVYYVDASQFRSSRYTKQCTKIDLDGKNCSLYLLLTGKQKSKNQLHQITIQRIQKQNKIYPINLDYRTNVLNNIIQFKGFYVQSLKMTSFGDYSFSSFKESAIMLYLSNAALNIQVSFQICKYNYSCEVSTFSQWEKLEQQNKTQQLYFQTKKQIQALDPFSSFRNQKTFKNASLVGFNNPYNSFYNYLKINNINVYIIYRQKDKSESIKFNPLLLSSYYHHRFYLNHVFSLSESYEFEITKYQISDSSQPIFLIQKKADENIRIYWKVINGNGSQIYFQPYVNKSINALDTVFNKYHVLSLNKDLNAAKIQIFVEDRLKRKINNQKPYYSIGWPSLSASQYPITLTQNNQKHTFAYLGGTKLPPKFQINSQYAMVVIHFVSQLRAFKDKIVLCTLSEQCYNHSNFRYWKNIENNEILSGLKATSQIMKGFKLGVTDFKIDGVHESKQNLYKLYSNMPIEVKITIKSVQTIIEVNPDGIAKHQDVFSDVQPQENQSQKLADEIKNKTQNYNQEKQALNKTLNITIQPSKEYSRNQTRNITSNQTLHPQNSSVSTSNETFTGPGFFKNAQNKTFPAQGFFKNVQNIRPKQQHNQTTFVQSKNITTNTTKSDNSSQNITKIQIIPSVPITQTKKQDNKTIIVRQNSTQTNNSIQSDVSKSTQNQTNSNNTQKQQNSVKKNHYKQQFSTKNLNISSNSSIIKQDINTSKLTNNASEKLNNKQQYNKEQTSSINSKDKVQNQVKTQTINKITDKKQIILSDTPSIQDNKNQITSENQIFDKPMDKKQKVSINQDIQKSYKIYEWGIIIIFVVIFAILIVMIGILYKIMRIIQRNRLKANTQTQIQVNQQNSSTFSEQKR